MASSKELLQLFLRIEPLLEEEEEEEEKEAWLDREEKMKDFQQ